MNGLLFLAIKQMLDEQAHAGSDLVGVGGGGGVGVDGAVHGCLDVIGGEDGGAEWEVLEIGYSGCHKAVAQGLGLGGMRHDMEQEPILKARSGDSGMPVFLPLFPCFEVAEMVS